MELDDEDVSPPIDEDEDDEADEDEDEATRARPQRSSFIREGARLQPESTVTARTTATTRAAAAATTATTTTTTSRRHRSFGVGHASKARRGGPKPGGNIKSRVVGGARRSGTRTPYHKDLPKLVRDGVIEPGPGVLFVEMWGYDLEPPANLTARGEITLPNGCGPRGQVYSPTGLLKFLAHKNQLQGFDKANGWQHGVRRPKGRRRGQALPLPSVCAYVCLSYNHGARDELQQARRASVCRLLLVATRIADAFPSFARCITDLRSPWRTSYLRGVEAASGGRR